MGLTRVQDWPERLHEYVELVKGERFAWGAFDCCLFAADAVRAMTGFDGAAPLRGRYASEDEAIALLLENGGLEAYVSGQLGEPKPILSAQRGDVVLRREAGEMDALGVCLGVHAAFAAPSGISLIPLGECHLAWSV